MKCDEEGIRRADTDERDGGKRRERSDALTTKNVEKSRWITGY